ncbi:MAG: Helicase superfamily 1 UvrD-related protein [Gemmatimonadetes bacterium]|nr:Helicase superfamily 1 UvrD-related protein [Gemmatimonadota bacterium]
MGSGDFRAHHYILALMADEPRLYRPRERDLPPSDEQKLTASLNPDQARAVTFGDAPLLVIAGAGTGKTRTLIHRVAALVDRGVPPERILLLTFTRRAAAEMLSRAEKLVGSAGTRVHGGTFHSVGHRLLRQFGPSAGLPADFTIMDQGDAEDLMQLARGAKGFAKTSKRFPKKETLHWLYSRHINTELPLDELLHRDTPHFLEYEEQITSLFADYTLRKQERNLVDYDDLLVFWALMLESSPALASRICGMYEHVLVDEYQDTNLLQARILRGMCTGTRKLTVVGDDAQSIYSFRGAHFRNILDFPRQFPGATMITLAQNYRSTQPILDLSNMVISRAEERFTKELHTDREGGEKPWLVTAKDEAQQTRFVVDRILQLHESGMPLAEMAVLFRAGYMSADLEIELANRKIPFEKWGGLKFLEAAHVKDVLAFLRVSENPRDEVSWYRILMLMPGIGDSTARSMMDTMQERSWDPDAFTHLIAPPKAREAHRSLAAMLRQLRGVTNRDGDTAGAKVASDIAAVRAIYDSVLKEKYDRPEARLADLDQLRTIAAGYPSRTSFLAALALDPPSSTQDLAGGSESESDALVLSTVHSAKGKEWKAVFVIWAVDGWFPSSKAVEDPDELEEERRLMYVALTRAKDELAVIYPMQVYGSRRSADYSFDQLSRFLDRGVRGTMQRIVVEEEGDTPPPEPVTTPAIDLRALMRGRFTK